MKEQSALLLNTTLQSKKPRKSIKFTHRKFCLARKTNKRVLQKREQFKDNGDSDGIITKLKQMNEKLKLGLLSKESQKERNYQLYECFLI